MGAQRLTAEEISVALLLAKCPKPEKIVALPALGSRYHQVQFSSGSPVLLEEIKGRPHEGIDHLLTVLRLAQKHPELPLPESLKLLTEGLVHPAWVYRIKDGLHGSQVEPLRAHVALGKAIRSMHDIKCPTRGTLPSGDIFIPRQNKWSDEMLLLAKRYATKARHNGAPHTALAQKLVDLIATHRTDLDAPQGGCLVHGSLRMKLIWVKHENVSALVGWQQACFGDVEQDWAPFLFDPALFPVLQGYGLDVVRARLSDPTTSGRLKAHFAQHLLRQLSQISERSWSAQKSVTLEAIATAARELLRPNAIEDQISAVMNDQTPAPLPVVHPNTVIARWALGGLAIRPQAYQSPWILGALASMYLASKYPDLAPGLIGVAAKACSLLPERGPVATLPEPFEAKSRVQSLAGQVLDDLESSERIWGQAAASLWLLGEAVRTVGSVEPHTVLAIEEHIRTLLSGRSEMLDAMETHQTNQIHLQNLFHGLMARGGLYWMQTMMRENEVSRVQEQLRRADHALRSAVNTLQLPTLVQKLGRSPLTETLASLSQAEDFNGPQWALPALLAAYDTLDPSWHDIFPAEALFKLLDVS